MTKKDVIDRKIKQVMEIYANPEAGRRFWGSLFDLCGPRFSRHISKGIFVVTPICPEGCFEPKDELEHTTG